MKKENIYVGKLMECKNVKSYLKDGETTFIPEFQTRTMQISTARQNIEVINEQAILIKTSKGYIYLNNITKLAHAILVDMGISIGAIGIKPQNDGDLFVLENTLIPYYNKNTDKHVFVKQLKRQVLIDSRIKIGIER